MQIKDEVLATVIQLYENISPTLKAEVFEDNWDLGIFPVNVSIVFL